MQANFYKKKIFILCEMHSNNDLGAPKRKEYNSNYDLISRKINSINKFAFAWVFLFFDEHHP